MKKLQLILISLITIVAAGCTTQNVVNNPTGIDIPTDNTPSVDETAPVVESKYTIKTGDRGDNVWEDIFVYDEAENLVLSLTDENEAQYYFSNIGNYLVLDNGTSASQRLIQVYDISKGEKIFETDYYPWGDELEQEWNTIRFFQRIENENLSKYPTLAICENEYDNGYITTMEYTIWETTAKDLQQVKCAYFE